VPEIVAGVVAVAGTVGELATVPSLRKMKMKVAGDGLKVAKAGAAVPAAVVAVVGDGEGGSCYCCHQREMMMMMMKREAVGHPSDEIRGKGSATRLQTKAYSSQLLAWQWMMMMMMTMVVVVVVVKRVVVSMWG